MSRAARALAPQGIPICVEIRDTRLGNPRFELGGGGSLEFGDCAIGEVRLFAGSFAPVGTLAANGDLLAIADHPALFHVIGNHYGGDGVNTFALPDLRDLAPGGVTYVICHIGFVPQVP